MTVDIDVPAYIRRQPGDVVTENRVAVNPL
jgi:hypothetical protein